MLYYTSLAGQIQVFLGLSHVMLIWDSHLEFVNMLFSCRSTEYADTHDDNVATIDTLDDVIVIVELHSGGSVCVHAVSPLYQGPQP